MKKLVDLLSRVQPNPDGVGIEIEVEGRGLPRPKTSPYWSVHDDGSLRGGIEYVTEGPLPVGSTKTKALNSLYTAMKSKGTINENQDRCGIHVHVGVQNLTVEQVYVAICVSLLMDQVLLEFCGADRKNNLFCKPVRGTRSIITMLKNDYKKTAFFSTMSNDLLKYSSLNLATLTKFGTLEYRGMRFLNEASEVDEWSTELYNMVHGSVNKWKDPKEFMDWYATHSKDELFNVLFSSSFTRKLKDSCPSWDKEINLNVKMCVDLAYGVKWDVNRLDKKKSKKPKVATDAAFANYIIGDGVPMPPPARLRGALGR